MALWPGCPTLQHFLYMYSQPIYTGKGGELNMVGCLQETKRHRCQMALIIKNKQPEIQLGKGKENLEREPPLHLTSVSL